MKIMKHHRVNCLSFSAGFFLLAQLAFGYTNAHANNAPVCDTAFGSPSSLWPVNHKFNTIGVEGIIDPDGDALSIAVQCIRQDEPLNTTGDGNTEYDGSGIGESAASVRAERKGNGNGRVYHIGFIATDSAGASCEGSVTVGVPKSKKRIPIDDGPLFESSPHNLSNLTNCGGQGGNNPPTALPQSVTTGQDTLVAIALEGTDADGDALVFSIVTSPDNGALQGVAPALSYIPNTGFTGTDTFSFQVSDGTDTSSTATVSITVLPESNTAPVADAGANYQAVIFELAQIQGSGSDAEGDQLTFSWQLVSKPPVSDVGPDIIELQSFEFFPDVVGDYTFELIVSDGILFSDPDDITITVVQPNRVPVASAGTDLTVEQGSIVTLDGSGTDPDQDVLAFQWSQIGGPETVSLSPNDSIATPDFTPSTVGMYAFELIANDGKLTSEPDQVQITVVEPVTNNTRPIADAGEDQDVPATVAVTLIGSGYDRDGDQLSYSWSLLDSPVGSQPALTELFDNVIEFRPDIVGSYRLGLTVSDGLTDSVVDVVQVEASTQNSAPIASATFFSQADQYERQGFFLDATASYDADYGDFSHQRLTYTWKVLEPSDPNLYQLDIETNSEESNAPDGYRGFIAIDYGIDVTISVVASDGFQMSEPFLLEIPAGATTPPIIVGDSFEEGAVGETIILPVGIAEAPNQPDGYNFLRPPDAYQVTWELLSQPVLSSAELVPQSQLITRVEPANEYELEMQLWDLEFSELRDTDPDVWQAQYDQLLAQLNGASGQTSINLDRAGRYLVKITADNLNPRGQTSQFIEILAETPGNTQPTARITNSSPQVVIVAANQSMISVDGSTSDDADGDDLTYEWTINELPYTSRAYLRDSGSAVAELVIDRRGRYTVSLVVDDGQRRSSAVQFEVNAQGTSPNSAPIAVTGTYANVASGTRIQLDGYRSSDPDGDPLRYQWRNVSAGDLQNVSVYQRNENFSSASVYASQPGEYVFELTASDWSLSSQPERVTVTVVPANTPPVADNGFSQVQAIKLKVGDTLALNADRSYDTEGAPLSYLWSATRLGGGDVLPLMPEASSTDITFSQAGEYLIKLLVSDGELSDLEIKRVNVFADPNQAPVTVFPDTITAEIGESVFLDGAGTYDPDGDRLQILPVKLLKGPWRSSIYAFPRKVDLVELASDIKGVFVISLAHTDSLATSIPAVVKFVVGDPKPVARISAVTQAISGSEITLSGTRSTDSNGLDHLSYAIRSDSFGFNWALISKPSGSTSTLDNPLLARPGILLDKPGDYVFELQVDDFYTSSNPVQHTITVEDVVNETPIAVITGASSVQPGVEIGLNGSLSTDADGDALTYEWSVVSSPSGSSPLIQEIGTANILFSADVAGNYNIQLLVSDQYSSDSAIHIVSVGSGSGGVPVANAGTDVNVNTGTQAVLDGTGSTSTDSSALEYLWSVVDSPQGSQWSLDGAETVNPIFSSSQAGVYTVQLVVTDGQRESTPDQVVITVYTVEPPNSTPVAVAGNDTTGTIGETISLIGSASTDADGDTLSFQWSFASQPTNSLATITDSDNEIASFIPDIQGSYIVELVVSDGVNFSLPDTISVDVEESGSGNSPPIPSAGYDQRLIVGTEVWLQWGLSYDADEGDVLDHSWSLESKPSGSTASVYSYSSGETAVELDVPGEYIVMLTVSDGKVEATDSVTFTAIATTVDLPEDPGPFSGASVFGFDGNQNGVRDDVERFISANYRGNTNLENSLYQLAASMRTVFSYSGNDALIGDALTLVNYAYECLYSIAEEDTRGTAADAVVAEILNNDARLGAFYEFGTSIEGHILIGNPIEEWTTSCNFEIQP